MSDDVFTDMIEDDPVVHDLKTLPSFFKAIADGHKPFEIRKDDRGFKLGDKLRLREWAKFSGVDGYSGRVILADVGYITDYEQRINFVVMGLKNIRFIERMPTNDHCPECGRKGLRKLTWQCCGSDEVTLGCWGCDWITFPAGITAQNWKNLMAEFRLRTMVADHLNSRLNPHEKKTTTSASQS